MKIMPLGPEAGLIKQIACLLHSEWGHLAAWANEAGITSAYESGALDPQEGITFVAEEGSTLMGVASLKRHELPHLLTKEWW